MSRAHVAHARRPLPALEPLLRLLARHRGRGRAIKLRDILLILGLRGFSDPGRAVREAINVLIANGYPIGSISAEGPRGGVSGYFWIETDAELLGCTAQLQGRIRELERRIEYLVSAHRNGPTQPMLFAAAPDGQCDAPAIGPTGDAEIANRLGRFVPPVRQFIAELERTTSAARTPEQRRRTWRGQQ